MSFRESTLSTQSATSNLGMFGFNLFDPRLDQQLKIPEFGAFFWMRREFSGEKPAGFDATNSAWAFTGFEAELLRDEKEKVLSLAEIRFRM